MFAYLGMGTPFNVKGALEIVQYGNLSNLATALEEILEDEEDIPMVDNVDINKGNIFLTQLMFNL